MRQRWLTLALVLLGVLAVGAIVGTLTGAGSAVAQSQAGQPGDPIQRLFSVKLFSSSPANPGEETETREGYTLDIAYQDTAGNRFQLNKQDNGTATIEVQASRSFWETKLEPLIQSLVDGIGLHVEE